MSINLILSVKSFYSILKPYIKAEKVLELIRNINQSGLILAINSSTSGAHCLKRPVPPKSESPNDS